MTETSYEVTIRRLGESDAEAIAALAQRDSAAVPHGTVLGAFDGRGALVAAISLEDDELIADPFTASGDAAALLRIHVHQMRGAHATRRHVRRFRRRRAGRTLAPA